MLVFLSWKGFLEKNGAVSRGGVSHHSMLGLKTAKTLKVTKDVCLGGISPFAARIRTSDKGTGRGGRTTGRAGVGSATGARNCGVTRRLLARFSCKGIAALPSKQALERCRIITISGRVRVTGNVGFPN